MPGAVTVYHGSPGVVRNPAFGKGRPYNDYGLGFYMTKNRTLAGEWAVFTTGQDGYINEYMLDYSGLRVLKLDEMPVENWIATLVANRGGRLKPVARRRRKLFAQKFLPDISAYDIIEGYRADDSFFSYVEDFMSGEISKEELTQALRLGDLGVQVCLKSEASFKGIAFTNSYPASVSEYYDVAQQRDILARRAYQEMLVASSGVGVKVDDLLEVN